MKKFLLGLAVLSMTAVMAGCVPAEEAEEPMDDTAVEEPTVVEPVVEEPVAEEPAAEEPAAEEPVAE